MGSTASHASRDLDYANVDQWTTQQVCEWVSMQSDGCDSSSVSSDESSSGSSGTSWPLDAHLVHKYDIDGRKLLALNEHFLNRIFGRSSLVLRTSASISAEAKVLTVLKGIEELRLYMEQLRLEQQQNQFNNHHAHDQGTIVDQSTNCIRSSSW